MIIVIWADVMLVYLDFYGGNSNDWRGKWKMTKQQEIREKIWQALRSGGLHISETDAMLEIIWDILYAKGVVLKVDKPLPDDSDYDQYVTKEWSEVMFNAGCIFTESLMEGVESQKDNPDNYLYNKNKRGRKWRKH